MKWLMTLVVAIALVGGVFIGRASAPSAGVPTLKTGVSIIPVVACPTTGAGEVSGPSFVPRQLTIELPTDEAAQLAAYTDSHYRLDPVLAPRGWRCGVSVGADGGRSLDVWPAREALPSTQNAAPATSVEDIAAYAVPVCQGCVAQMVCPFFRSAVPLYANDEPPCPKSRPPQETVTIEDGPSTGYADLAYVYDAPNLDGSIYLSGGSNPAWGVVRFNSYGSGLPSSNSLSCVLPQAESVLCGAITHYFALRDWGLD